MTHVMSRSIVTCPFCGFRKEEIIPTDACQFFYQCTNCGRVMRPKTGDCCIFCSYGSVQCLSKQRERKKRFDGQGGST
jgi:rubredoxin